MQTTGAARTRADWAPVVVAALVAAGVALRFTARSHLWLDEALSVDIARLPLRELPSALRHDGSPPLYYALLHLWMRAFGSGSIAVRALSGAFGAASLPLMWAAGRRSGGRAAAVAGLVLLASSPFAVRYATEARMYSLVVVLVLLGYLAVLRARERPSAGRLAAVAAVTAALLYTHYWTIPLLAVTAAVLLWRGGSSGRRAVAAMVAGGMAFLPWAPAFVFQLRQTGTPWAGAARPRLVVDAVFDFAGGRTDAGSFLAVALVLLVVAGALAEPLAGGGLAVRGRLRPGAGPLAAASLGTLGLAALAGLVTHTTFTGRYAAVVLAPFLLLAALGAVALANPRARRATLAAVAALGLVGCWANVRTERTAAGRVAAALVRRAAPGDVVVYCPDQLGPSVSRLLPARYRQLTFPTGGLPDRVDWVDYQARNRRARTIPFVQRLLATAGDRDIWLVWAPGYRTYGTRCENLQTQLEKSRPDATRPVKLRGGTMERAGLVRYRP